jgi:hypothetical protein
MGPTRLSIGFRRRSNATRQAIDVNEAKLVSANDAYYGALRLAA